MNNKQTIYMTLWNVVCPALVRDKRGRGVRETDMCMTEWFVFVCLGLTLLTPGEY